MFQFTHPGKGATTATSKTQELFNCVSIHAPWEGCDCTDALAIVHAINVSIHAPWEGCDPRYQVAWRTELKFQFTHPGKGATKCRSSSSVRLSSFNSRTLGRVRRDAPNLRGAGGQVSIHAPWEGCDGEVDTGGGSSACFNSRTLGRVRQQRKD